MTAKGRLNVRDQVNYQILNQTSKLTQDWSEVEKKATSFLGIYKLIKGWWSYCLALFYVPAFSNITMTGTGLAQMTAEDNAMRQVSFQMSSCPMGNGQYPLYVSKRMFRTGVRRLSRTLTKIRHILLEKKIGGANSLQRVAQIIMSLPSSN